MTTTSNTVYFDDSAAAALIAQSQSHNEIAEAVWTEGAHAALAGLADDWTDTNDGYDYWGADADGKWRVELSVASAVAAAAADIRLRYIVRDGIEAEDGGPCQEWWVYRDYLHGIGEYEPGFPIADEDWREDEDFEAQRFSSEADAANACRALNAEVTP